jgi:hypothetical protein
MDGIDSDMLTEAWNKKYCAGGEVSDVEVQWHIALVHFVEILMNTEIEMRVFGNMIGMKRILIVHMPEWHACVWVNAEMIPWDMQSQQGSWAVPYLRWLVLGVRTRRHGVDPRPVHMWLVTEKVALAQDTL